MKIVQTLRDTNSHRKYFKLYVYIATSTQRKCSHEMTVLKTLSCKTQLRNTLMFFFLLHCVAKH